MPLEGPRYRSPLTSGPSATCAATGKSRSSPSRSCREKAKPGGGAGLTPQTPRMSFQGPTPPLRGGSLHSPRPLRGPTPPAPPAPGLLEPSPNPGPARFLLRRTPPPLTPPQPPAPPRISSIPTCPGLRTSPGERHNQIKGSPTPDPSSVMLRTSLICSQVIRGRCPREASIAIPGKGGMEDFGGTRR